MRSASRRARVIFLAETRWAISARSSAMPMPSPGAQGDHGHLGQAVGDEEPAYVVQHRLAAVLGHGVDVVEHDDHDVAVRRERREVAVVDRGVGVLLRVQHPHQQVGQLHQPVDLEVVRDLGRVVVGQVEQHHALQGVVLPDGVQHRVARGLVARRDAEPLEQLVGALTAPHAGGRPRGRGTAYADRRELEAGQRVERGGLARPGGTGDRDHGVVRGEAQPAGGTVDDRARVVDELVVETAACGDGRLVEPVDAGTDVGASGDQLLGTLEQGRHVLPRRRIGQCCDNPRGSPPQGVGSPPRCTAAKRRSSTRRDAARSCSGASALIVRPSRSSR